MTTSITLRNSKGSALTFTEVDDNFSNLKTTADAAKATADAAAVAGAVGSSGLTMATSKLLGRTTASTGAIEEITAGAGLSLSTGQLEVDFTGYLTTTDAASTYQTQAGMSSYLTTTSAASTYQPLDGDLTAIAGLSGTTGLLKKTAADTWSLDTATYLTTTDAASTYQTQSGMSSYLTTTDASSTYQTQAGMSSYLTTATAASTYQTQSGMSSYLTSSSASSTYLAKSGGTLTGALTTTSLDIGTQVTQAVVAVAASAVDCSAGNYFTKTATGALTWTFTNVPASKQYAFALALTNGGAGTQTWPAAVVWNGGTAPTLQTSGTDIIVFMTSNGGTTWRGVRAWKQA